MHACDAMRCHRRMELERVGSMDKFQCGMKLHTYVRILCIAMTACATAKKNALITDCTASLAAM